MGDFFLLLLLLFTETENYASLGVSIFFYYKCNYKNISFVQFWLNSHPDFNFLSLYTQVNN